ncbi:hypothetical protein J559_3242 [Acinetobacter sp. 983759]|nr:hypothetical protein J559_3242 [Acinetobacter sp. 983759]
MNVYATKPLQLENAPSRKKVCETSKATSEKSEAGFIREA